MSDFRTATTPLQRIDPFKRVKYSLGLVLGVDEFEQEQGFFLERGRMHNRLLHGYGTVWGLRVTYDGEKITVAPGLAVDPLGREIRVPQAQCAELGEWLSANHPESHDGSLNISVLLSYRECETDRVPVPGAPCRSEEENLAPSRISETFDLKFSLSRPNEQEEEGVRAFGELLSRIVVTNEHPDDVITVQQLEQQVRALAMAVELDSPISGGTIYVKPEDAQAMFEAAFRVWVTELRPKLMERQVKTPNGTPVEQAVLLGWVNVGLDADWNITGVTVHEEDRPYLLQTRMLQEFLTAREQPRDHGVMEGLEDDDHPQYLDVNPSDRSLKRNLNANGHKVVELAKATKNGDAVPFQQAVKVEDQADGDVGGFFPEKLIVKGIGGHPIAEVEPEENAVLVFNGSEWVPKKGSGDGVTDHSLLVGLEKDDHKQYLRVDGLRALTGNLDANGRRITNLSTSVANGDPVVRGEGAGGDLAGTYPSPTVARLNGRVVASWEPVQGSVMTWDGIQWSGQPVEVVQPVARQLPVTPFVSIARVPRRADRGPSFRLWFHLDPGKSMIDELQQLEGEFEVGVFLERVDATTGHAMLFEQAVAEVIPHKLQPNVYTLDLREDAEQEPRNIRFVFYLPSMKLTNGSNVLELLASKGIKYMGHDGGEFAVAYWGPETGLDWTKPRVVATGEVSREGWVGQGNIQCELVSEYHQYDENHYYRITFPGYRPEGNYLVSGVPLVHPGTGQWEAPPVFCWLSRQDSEKPGLQVELRRQQDGWPIQYPFHITVTEMPGMRYPDNW